MDTVLGALLAPEIFPYAAAGALVLVLALGFNGAPLWLWSLFLVGVATGFGLPVVAIGVLVAILAIFNIPPIRKALVSSGVMATMKALKLIPKISET